MIYDTLHSNVKYSFWTICVKESYIFYSALNELFIIMFTWRSKEKDCIKRATWNPNSHWANQDDIWSKNCPYCFPITCLIYEHNIVSNMTHIQNIYVWKQIGKINPDWIWLFLFGLCLFWILVAFVRKLCDKFELWVDIVEKK